MSFWEGFYTLPQWFIMGFLVALLVGLLFVINELANRKMKISKEGFQFDRLRERKSLLLQFIELRHKQKKEKIRVEDL
jgi:hypothetical protein